MQFDFMSFFVPQNTNQEYTTVKPKSLNAIKGLTIILLIPEIIPLPYT